MNKKCFQDIVAEDFTEICRNFQLGLPKKGFQYDEDVMSDVYLSCFNALKDKLLTKEEAIKYYWTAYINKMKTIASKQNFIVSFEDVLEEDIEDVPYNNSTDSIYQIITNELQDKFGVRTAIIWELHACHGMTTKEIKNMGYVKDTNLAYLSKKMKRYIKNHIIQENEKLKEIIENREEF